MARSSGSAIVNLESALESANSALVVLQNDLGRDVYQDRDVMAGFVHLLQGLDQLPRPACRESTDVRMK